MIALEGADYASLSERQRSETVFLLSQHTAVRAALVVFELIFLAKRRWPNGKASDYDVTHVANTLDLLGIEYLSDRIVTELSGGQQQLVALCRPLHAGQQGTRCRGRSSRNRRTQ